MTRFRAKAQGIVGMTEVPEQVAPEPVNSKIRPAQTKESAPHIIVKETTLIRTAVPEMKGEGLAKTLKIMKRARPFAVSLLILAEAEKSKEMRLPRKLCN